VIYSSGFIHFSDRLVVARENAPATIEVARWQLQCRSRRRQLPVIS
jgi:hypothetical protein